MLVCAVVGCRKQSVPESDAAILEFSPDVRVCTVDIGAHPLGRRVRRAATIRNGLGRRVLIVGFRSECRCGQAWFLTDDGTEVRPSRRTPIPFVPGQQLRLVVEQAITLRGPFSYPLLFQTTRGEHELPTLALVGFGCENVYSTAEGEYRDAMLFEGMPAGSERSFSFHLHSVDRKPFSPVVSGVLPEHLRAELRPLGTDRREWLLSGTLEAGLFRRTVGGMIPIGVGGQVVLALRVLGTVDSALTLDDLPFVDLGVLDRGPFVREVVLAAAHASGVPEELRVLETRNLTSAAWRINASIVRAEAALRLRLSGTVLGRGRLEARIVVAATGALEGRDVVVARAIAR